LTLGLLATMARLEGFNGATFDRIRTLADNGDAQANLTLGLLATIARNQGFNGATWDRLRTIADNADNQANLITGLLSSIARQELYNGVTWDRSRNNNELTFLASAVRNATNASADFINYNANRLIVFINITAVPGVDTITAAIENKDPISGGYITIGTGSGALVATGLYSFNFNPSTFALSRTFRINVTHSGAGNFTYSIGGSLIIG